MKKKFLGILSLIFMLMFSAVLDASAVIRNENDINVSVRKLRELSSKDMMQMVHKSELVGFRYDAFVMATTKYQRSAGTAASNLQKISNSIELVKNSTDFSDTEKDMQINKLLQEADSEISKVQTDSMSYLTDLQEQIPTITYQQFVKKFLEYYNGLNLAGSRIYAK